MRIDAITKLLNEAWSRVPQYTLGRLLAEMDPAFVANPHHYSDDELQKKLHETIADLDKQDEIVKRIMRAR